MKREQLIATVNQTALNAWIDYGITLMVYEETRGKWTIWLNNVRQTGIPTSNVFYVINAMIATAKNFRSKGLQECDKDKVQDLVWFEKAVYENMGQTAPADTPAQRRFAEL